MIYSFITPLLEADGLSKTLLDVCCGTGQFDTLFLQNDYRVAGIDLSPEMINHAKNNNKEWVSNGYAVYSEMDAADISLTETYSCAVSLYDALNHLPTAAELQICFRGVYNCLCDGGFFIFDLNTRKGLLRWNGISVQEDDEFTIISRGVYDMPMERAFTTISGFARNEKGTYDRFSETVYNTVYDMIDVCTLLEKAGFSDIRMTDGVDFTKMLPDPEEAGRVFFVVKK